MPRNIWKWTRHDITVYPRQSSRYDPELSRVEKVYFIPECTLPPKPVICNSVNVIGLVLYLLRIQFYTQLSGLQTKVQYAGPEYQKVSVPLFHLTEKWRWLTAGLLRHMV
jgi:hypothetical protein